MTRCEILIVGAGPAGIAAASVCGDRALWIDDNPAAGGQIWRGGKPVDGLSETWFGKVRLRPRQARVVQAERRHVLVETLEGQDAIVFDQIILTTGARELYLPFPGWTLPGAFGAGGLQALVKSGWPVDGKRVVVAGSGPLLIAVASYLRSRGARVVLVAEQAPMSRVAKFLLTYPAKLLQGARLARGLPYRTSSWVTRFTGRSAVLNQGGEVGCELLATGYGLVPNDELRAQFPPDDANVFLAGEAAGIGGVEKSLVEGEMAGLRALGADDSHLHDRHRACLRFAEHLNRTFELRDELRQLSEDDTIVCRCEDVRFGALKGQAGWRAAKLQTRCGMGPCQGRVCGPANRFVFGWDLPAGRPPLFPAKVDTLLQDMEIRK